MTDSPEYRAGWNAAIDRARKVLISRCARVFDAALAAEKMPEPKGARVVTTDPAHIDPQWPS